MARIIRRSSFVRRVGPRRATQWGASADTTGGTALAAATSQIDQQFTEAILQEVSPGTVQRVRGELWVVSDQVVATEQPFGAIGFAVVSEQARAAGAASLPAPITNEDSDLWFVHQFWHTDIRVFDATGNNFNTAARYSFDSKAQRKFTEGEAIVVMIENASATHGVTYWLKFRMLFKLH